MARVMKFPGYIEGPWFPPREQHKSERSSEETDTCSTEVEVPGKNDSGRNNERKLPGRIEGHWFCSPTKGTAALSGFYLNHVSHVNGNPSAVDASPSLGNIRRDVEAISLVPEYDEATCQVLAADTDGESHRKPRFGDKIIAAESLVALANMASAPTLQDSAENGVNDTLAGDSAHCQNFFSKTNTSFVHVHVDNRGFVATVQFLDACREIPVILDMLGGRAFGPVKSDVNGNITKLSAHHNAAPEDTGTLQEMVLREVGANAHKSSGSATDALLWLKRTLIFMDVFLVELLSTTDETRECAFRAYKSSLEPHHSFIVRGAFRVSVYALPLRKDFIAALADKKEDVEDPVYVAKLVEDARVYSASLRHIVSLLHTFYVTNKLE